VVGIEPGFRVRLASASPLRAHRILMATGLRDELPDAPGARERWGRDLLHCSYCHGYEVRDQPLGVLEGSPEAVQHALLVCQWSPEVALFPHTDTLAPQQRELLTARGIRIVDGTIARLVVDNDQLHGVELDGGTVVARAAVFVRPRFVPNADLLTGLGCAVDEHGWVVHDPVGHRRRRRLGRRQRCRSRAQVITAAGQGSATAIALNAHLVDEDVKRALTGHGAGHRARPA
jgi:thioredoxin reductase